MRPTPFSRLRAFVQGRNAVDAMPRNTEALAQLWQAALNSLGAYKSRGKGRGTPSKRFGSHPGKYAPHWGAKQTARLQRRIEARVAG